MKLTCELQFILVLLSPLLVACIRKGRVSIDCPQDRLPRCSDLKDWLRDQRSQGRCSPFQPQHVKCYVGLVPRPGAADRWKPGQPCSEFYERRICTALNAPSYSPPSSDQNGLACTPHTLGVEDCQALESATEKPDELLALVEDLMARGGDNLFELPSAKLAIWKLGGRLEEMVANSVDDGMLNASAHDKEQHGVVWRTLLTYCDSSAERAEAELRGQGRREDRWVLQREANRIADEDCKTLTNLDLMAQYHPAVKSFKEDFKGVDDLRKMRHLGLFYLTDKTWMRLAKLAGADEDLALRKLNSKMQDLVKTAGDRSEEELEFALQINGLTIAGGVEPDGGMRRLQEMKALRGLKNCMYAVHRSSIEKALKAARDLLEEGGIEWVDAGEFNSALASAETFLASWGLEQQCAEMELDWPCTQAQIDTKRCTDMHLPPNCTQEDIAALILLRSQCVAVGLKESCTRAELDMKQELIQSCLRHDLEETCTQVDIDKVLRLRQQCAEYSLPDDCAQGDIDYAEALRQRCAEMGLLETCTQREIDAITTTTTTTTALQSCAITERTHLSAGVSFAYDVKPKCNKITCSVVNFMDSGLKQFVIGTSRKGSNGGKCVCERINEDGSAAPLFEYRDWRKDCGTTGCWREYAELVSRATGARLSAQMLDRHEHWRAKCVDMETAVTILPSVEY